MHDLDPRGRVGPLLVQGLVVEQCLGEGVELVAVVGEQVADGLVAVVDDAPDLGVDRFRGGLGRCARARKHDGSGSSGMTTTGPMVSLMPQTRACCGRAR